MTPSQPLTLPGLGLDRTCLDSLQLIYLDGPTLLQNTIAPISKNCVGVLMNHKKKRRSAVNPHPLALAVRCQYICRNFQLQDISLQNEKFGES